MPAGPAQGIVRVDVAEDLCFSLLVVSSCLTASAFSSSFAASTLVDAWTWMILSNRRCNNKLCTRRSRLRMIRWYSESVEESEKTSISRHQASFSSSALLCSPLEKIRMGKKKYRIFRSDGGSLTHKWQQQAKTRILKKKYGPTSNKRITRAETKNDTNNACISIKRQLPHQEQNEATQEVHVMPLVQLSFESWLWWTSIELSSVDEPPAPSWWWWGNWDCWMFCNCWANEEFASLRSDAVGSDESCCGVAVAAVSVAMVCNFWNKIISIEDKAIKKPKVLKNSKKTQRCKLWKKWKRSRTFDSRKIKFLKQQNCNKTTKKEFFRINELTWLLFLCVHKTSFCWHARVETCARSWEVHSSHFYVWTIYDFDVGHVLHS